MRSRAARPPPAVETAPRKDKRQNAHREDPHKRNSLERARRLGNTRIGTAIPATRWERVAVNVALTQQRHDRPSRAAPRHRHWGDLSPPQALRTPVSTLGTPQRCPRVTAASQRGGIDPRTTDTERRDDERTGSHPLCRGSGKILELPASTPYPPNPVSRDAWQGACRCAPKGSARMVVH